MRVNKQPGEKWLVMLRQGGGQLDIDAKDDAVFDSDEGLIIYHNDADKTVTFAPKEGIGFIRAYHPQGAGGFSKMRGSEALGHAPTIPSPSTPVIDVQGTRELSRRASGADDTPESVLPVRPCPICQHATNQHNRDGCKVACPCLKPYVS